MYTRRVQIHNYGPIDQLDINLPFDGENPKPILLVGENGSGKSILLSHIVNGIIGAKGIAYPETPEVELGKVYKIRSSSYIKSRSEYYFVRVDFEEDMFVTEMRLLKPKEEYENAPKGLSELGAEDLWAKMKPNADDNYMSSFSRKSESSIRNLFSKNCVLYFPPNRFEEPAWLNEQNLKAQAKYMDLEHLEGFTDRRVIEYSPLDRNQNWLFDLSYDRAVFEIQTRQIDVPISNTDTRIPLPIFAGYAGNAARIYEAVLHVVRAITNREDARLGIGRRINRIVTLESDATGQIVPNIFQLSSGETSLLNLFLSIMRDFDLCGTSFSNSSDIRGIVVVDEIDLHLHAIHQYEVLPQLIRMFPRVQFVVTTHSPLFVLGMNKAFGQDGFTIFRMPQGRQISPEEFSEFGNAYEAFTDTIKFTHDIQISIAAARKPIVFVEGSTDIRYIQKASRLLDHLKLIERIEIRDGDGAPNLRVLQ